MYLVYADEQGNVYDHPELYALARSGDMIVEILEEELVPLPEGATLVGLPSTRAIGMNPETGEMLPLLSRFAGCRSLAAAGIHPPVPSRLRQDRQDLQASALRIFRCSMEGRRILCGG